VKSNILSEFKEDPLLSIIDFLTRYFGGKKQFLPNSDELENKGVIELLERLKGKSKKETLSNLLEWQNRNIIFWTDRMYYSLILYLLLIISVYFLPVNDVTKNILAFILVLMGIVNFTLMLSYGITLIATILIFTLWVFSVNPLQAQKFYPVAQLVILSLIFGAFLALVGYLTLKYSALKSRIPGFELKDTFNVSLQVDKILKYRLAVCKDYAKLTAVLLHNLFPNSQIYFISIPWHVATGIEVNGKLYFLDQKLPVLTLDSWLRVWNRKTATIYQLKVLDLKNRKKLVLEKRGIAKLANHSMSVNTEKLTEEATKQLKINRTSQKETSASKIPFLNFVKCYDDEEIVVYSMARAIKLKLENELCSNFENIEKIEIKQDEEDLIVFAYLINKCR
jgi:predicted transglutaminase-like protease